ncbi:TIGR02444 family protein [uncultured Ferrimonas sp.]|uniref:TIGR02444 family protein n=1 Tax=uncultured Ferrimonas sp. TaxID=432640 RepID=UPI00261C28F3|nr:TIGR02444 family protein [uncultured Ferrimonas sp.]
MITLQEFAAFSDKIWSQNQARTTALTLQDQHHIEPNLLLLALYLEQRHLYLNESQYRQLQQAQQSWVDSMLQPYRQLRKLAKQNLAEGDYRQMLAVELALERRSQQLIIRHLNGVSYAEDGDNFGAFLASQQLEVHLLPGTLLEQLGQLFSCTEPSLPTYDLR